MFNSIFFYFSGKFHRILRLTGHKFLLLTYACFRHMIQLCLVLICIREAHHLHRRLFSSDASSLEFSSFSCSSESLPITRSEEHTSELQSRFDLVCRLL